MYISCILYIYMYAYAYAYVCVYMHTTFINIGRFDTMRWYFNDDCIPTAFPWYFAYASK